MCLGALASRNSNLELVSHFFVFRPIADVICHTPLKISSLRHWCRVLMVMSAFPRDDVDRLPLKISAQTISVAQDYFQHTQSEDRLQVTNGGQ